MSKQDKKARNNTSSNKEYEQPELIVWGSVTELTGVGCTRPGEDDMGGSVHRPSAPEGSPGGECTFE